jgi:hypothetical protein
MLSIPPRTNNLANGDFVEDMLWTLSPHDLGPDDWYSAMVFPDNMRYYYNPGEKLLDDSGGHISAVYQYLPQSVQGVPLDYLHDSADDPAIAQWLSNPSNFSKYKFVYDTNGNVYLITIPLEKFTPGSSEYHWQLLMTTQAVTPDLDKLRADQEASNPHSFDPGIVVYTGNPSWGVLPLISAVPVIELGVDFAHAVFVMIGVETPQSWYDEYTFTQTRNYYVMVPGP